MRSAAGFQSTNRPFSSATTTPSAMLLRIDVRIPVCRCRFCSDSRSAAFRCSTSRAKSFQGLFGPVAVGDVPEHHLRADDPLPGIADRGLQHLDVADFAIGFPVALDIFEQRAGRQHLFVTLRGTWPPVRAEKCQNRSCR